MKYRFVERRSLVRKVPERLKKPFQSRKRGRRDVNPALDCCLGDVVIWEVRSLRIEHRLEGGAGGEVQLNADAKPDNDMAHFALQKSKKFFSRGRRRTGPSRRGWKGGMGLDRLKRILPVFLMMAASTLDLLLLTLIEERR